MSSNSIAEKIVKLLVGQEHATTLLSARLPLRLLLHNSNTTPTSMPTADLLLLKKQSLTCIAKPLARGSDKLANLDTVPVTHDTLKADIQLIHRENTFVFWGASVEMVVPESKHPAFLRKSRKGRSRWSVIGVRLIVADGVLGSDVNLLATGYFHVLALYILAMPEREECFFPLRPNNSSATSFFSVGSGGSWPIAMA